MIDAFRNAAHQFRLSSAKSGLRSILVARENGFVDPTQEGANSRAARLVDSKPALVLAGAFFGLWRVGHDFWTFRRYGSISIRETARKGPGVVRAILAKAGITRMSGSLNTQM